MTSATTRAGKSDVSQNYSNRGRGWPVALEARENRPPTNTKV
jgi:hypothetical protein